MDRKYLDKLDINYFKECINEQISYYITEGFCDEDKIKGLKTLYTRIVGLRDTFFIFSIDDIIELLKPVKEILEEADTWHEEEQHKMIEKGSDDWKLAEKYKLLHPTYASEKVAIKEVWRDINNTLCVKYESSFGKNLDWFHYKLDEKNYNLVWW